MEELDIDLTSNFIWLAKNTDTKKLSKIENNPYLVQGKVIHLSSFLPLDND